MIARPREGSMQHGTLTVMAESTKEAPNAIQRRRISPTTERGCFP
jgi:hypothetical protein